MAKVNKTYSYILDGDAMTPEEAPSSIPQKKVALFIKTTAVLQNGNVQNGKTT